MAVVAAGFRLMAAVARRLLLLALVVPAVAPAAAVEADKVADTVWRVGIAYAEGSDRVLYREMHEARWRDGRPVTEVVTYREPNGDRIAVKTIDYRQSMQAPAFHLKMESLPYEEGLAKTDDGLQAFVRRSGAASMERRLLDVERENLVADAGFDRFIHRRFEAVKAGTALTFRFLVPSRLKSYEFRAQKVADTTMLGQPAVHLRLEPTSFFLRWLAEPIDVWYARSDGRLLRYVGPSNLRSPDGGNPRVRVDFPRGATPVKRDGATAALAGDRS